MNDSELLLVCIIRVRQLASDLRRQNIAVENEEIAVTVFYGLPELFEHRMITIDAMTSEGQLTTVFEKSR